MENIKTFSGLRKDDIIYIEWKHTYAKSKKNQKQYMLGRVFAFEDPINGPIFVQSIVSSDTSLVKQGAKVGITKEVLRNVVEKKYSKVGFRFTKLQKLKESEATIYMI
jgi:hypothetical protein